MKLIAAIISILLLTVLTFAVAPAYAAESVNPDWYSAHNPEITDTPNVAASGTVVAAALETAGYRAQQYVLEDLGEMLGSLAVLIYISCFILGLAAVTMTNQYSVAVWLLIGPALFHFLIYNTTDAGGAQWQYGAFDGGQAAVSEAVIGMGFEVDSEVSWFFHEFNVFVSGVVQSMIKVVSNNNIKEQSLFMVRQRILGELLEAQIESPGLTELVRFNTWTCSNELHAARIIALGKRDPAFRHTVEYRQAATLYYDRPWSEIRKAFEDIYAADKNPALRGGAAEMDAIAILKGKSARVSTNKHQIRHLGALKYLRWLYDKVQLYLTDGMPIVDGKQQSNFTDKSKLFFNEECLKLDTVPNLAKEVKTNDYRQVFMTCEQLWCWMAAGVQVEAVEKAQKAANSIAAAKNGGHMTDEQHDNFLKQIYNDIAKKLTAPDKLKVEFAVEVLGQDGRTTVDKKERYVGGNVDPDPSVVPIIIAGYMIRKAMQGDVVNSMREQLTHHTGSNSTSHSFDLSRQKDEKYSSDEMQYFYNEMLEHQYSAQQQGMAFTLALMLPYAQGVILYALALLYPFFCLMVLIPGRAGSFLGWMAFWVWAKSWDLGWSFVMVVDTALWQLMPHNGTYDPIRDPNNGPITIFETAFEGDSAYSLSGYYILLGMMINSVPIVTGRLVLGAKMAIGGVLVDAMKVVADNYGGQSAAFIANEQCNDIEMIRYSNTYNHAVQALSSANFGNVGDLSFYDPPNTKGLNLLGKKFKSYANLINEVQNQAKKMEELSNTQTVTGSKLAALGLISGNAATGTLSFGITALQQKALKAASVKYSQMANAMMANYYRKNYQLQHYMYAQGAAHQDLVALQGAVSKRGEYWNHPDFPQGMVGGVAQDMLKSKNAFEELKEKYKVNLALGQD